MDSNNFDVRTDIVEILGNGNWTEKVPNKLKQTELAFGQPWSDNHSDMPKTNDKYNADCTRVLGGGNSEFLLR